MESDITRGSNGLITCLHHTETASEENAILSPLSLYEFIMIMSQNPGCRNKEKFTQLLQISESVDATKPYKNVISRYKNVISRFSSLNKRSFQISSRAFLNKEYKLHEAFKNLLVEDFLCGIESVDMNSVEAVVRSINTWVQVETGQQIADFLIPEIIDSDMCLSLSNAFNFSGKWAKPFKLENTTPAPFYFDGGSTEVNMMKTKIQANYKYAHYLGIHVLELPYAEDDVSLLILLPDKDTDIRRVQENLNWDNLRWLLEDMSMSEVDVSLPRFRIEKERNFRTIFKKLGMENEFSENANLFGMLDSEEFINLGDVYEEGVFNVHEEGSEAATASVFTFVPSKSEDKEYPPKDGLVIYEMNIKADVANRFSRNLITSKVRNTNETPKEAIFTVVLPETAFIVKFVMEIKGKAYESYIKEKEKAKAIYKEAVHSGRSAGIVEASARNSNEFNVSVNLEPNSVAVFYLTYEELLQRVHDQYELVLNIRPGQVVEKLNVEVNINESRPLKFVRTPALRSGNEIIKHDEYLKPSADIKVDKNSALVKFSPDAKQQKRLAIYLKNNMEEGFAGQFVVQYDVEREPRSGEILLQDGYFVHFFAPNDLDPLPKHVVFVLDTSSSMGGRKVSQLKDAMMSILDELRKDDMVSLVEFNNKVMIWNIDSETSTTLENFYIEDNAEDPFNRLSELSLPSPTYANNETINKAKNVIQRIQVNGCTYIVGGLIVALYLIKNQQRRNAANGVKHQPILIFLTDGEPNVGVSSPAHIVKIVTRLNLNNNKAPIFSLSFGDGADKEFLRQLSLRNFGFSRHIYEASDASLQLQSFYKQISSPLLTDIQFNYESADEVTNSSFPIYFGGGEIVVSGRCTDSSLPATINCCGIRGPIVINSVVERPVSPLERLWAYLTVRQLLEQAKTAENKTDLIKRATELALQYSFVTEVTSLVVVRPEESNAVNIGDEPGIEDEGELGALCSSDDASMSDTFSDTEAQVRFHRGLLSIDTVASDNPVVPEVMPMMALMSCTQSSVRVLRKRAYNSMDDAAIQFGSAPRSDGAAIQFGSAPRSGGAAVQFGCAFQSELLRPQKKSLEEDKTTRFTVDRPFLIVLRVKNENGDIILFVGRVHKPCQ